MCARNDKEIRVSEVGMRGDGLGFLSVVRGTLKGRGVCVCVCV